MNTLIYLKEFPHVAASTFINNGQSTTKPQQIENA